MAQTTVLMVDDDPASLAFNSALLRDDGFVVDQAISGRQALVRVQSHAPEMIFTKLLMPDGDGIELITALRTSHPAVNIIALSERRYLAELDLFYLATKLGAAEVLDAPVRPLRLLTAARRLATSTSTAARRG